MMLLSIKHYIRDRQRVTLQGIARHFQRDPDVMRDMLSHWLRKGIIKKAPKPPGCGARCTQCLPEIAEVYCWCGAEITRENRYEQS